MTPTPSRTARSLLGAVLAATVIASLWASLPASANGAQRERGLADRLCESDGRLRADTLPSEISTNDCDLTGRVIVSGMAALRVPPPGHGVSAAAVGTGAESELYIYTTHSGVVRVSSSHHSSTPSPATALLAPGFTEPCDENSVGGCLAPCDTNSNAVNPNSAKVKKGQPWRWRNNAPAPLTNTYALAQIKAGTKNVVNVRNSCGLPDVVPKTSAYKGTTTAGTGMTHNGTSVSCGNGNAKNTVEFGALPANVLGFACAKSQRIGTNPWFIIEGDIRLNKDTSWTTTIDDPGCSGSYDVQSVMTHERAHSFGVFHASGTAQHSQLTMAPSSYACNSYARTFGKGDHTALKKLY